MQLCLGWAVGCARVRRRFEARGLPAQAGRRTSVQFARGRACVRGGCCVNRELSVAREIWRAGRLGEGGRDKAVGCDYSMCARTRMISICVHILMNVFTYSTVGLLISDGWEISTAAELATRHGQSSWLQMTRLEQRHVSCESLMSLLSSPVLLLCCCPAEAPGCHQRRQATAGGRGTRLFG